MSAARAVRIGRRRLRLGHGSCRSGCRRDTRHSHQPVPTISTPMSNGVSNTTRWRSVGSRLVASGQAKDDHHDADRQDQDLAQTRLTAAGRSVGSATVRLDRDPDRRDQDPAGVGGALARGEPGLRSVEGHGQVGVDDRVGRFARW